MKGKVAFYTLGCKLNFSETSTIGKQFIDKGYEVVKFDEYADVYLINTCTVTENADRECRQIVRRALRNNPNAFIAVTGCYAQLKPDEISNIKGVDIVLGSNEKFKLFHYVTDFNKTENSCIYVTPTEKISDFESANSTIADSRTRAFFKIQDGCDYKCTYCTIPLARGKSRSMNIDEVEKRFRSLIDEGYKEVILTGVNVGDYGEDSDYTLYDVLKRLIEVDGDFRIRISSIEPNLLTDEIISLTKSSEKLVNHFHIPLQSGSDKILKLMKRRYNTALYRNLIEKIKSEMPEAGIGIDVIVGFPGETDEDFQTTFDFLNSLDFTYLHVFTYSERPNTPAIGFDGRVEIIDRKERNNRLRILSEKKRQKFYREMLGTEQIVLFEEKNNDGYLKGFSSNYIRVSHKFDSSLMNKLVKVKLKEFDGETCSSELLIDEVKNVS